MTYFGTEKYFKLYGSPWNKKKKNEGACFEGHLYCWYIWEHVEEKFITCKPFIWLHFVSRRRRFFVFSRAHANNLKPCCVYFFLFWVLLFSGTCMVYLLVRSMHVWVGSWGEWEIEGVKNWGSDFKGLKSVSCCMLLHSIERKRKWQLANKLVL